MNYLVSRYLLTCKKHLIPQIITLLHKLHHYEIRDLSNNWFSSYLCKRKEFISINEFNSATQSLGYVVPQWSVLGPILFLIYIIDLHNAVNFSNIHSKISKIYKSLNKDLKELSFWLNANKIALNVEKQGLYFLKLSINPVILNWIQVLQKNSE